MASKTGSWIFWLELLTTSVTLLCVLCLHVVIGETTVRVTAPVNPVKESGIISVRCQIWDLQPRYKVTINGPDDVTFTFDEEVIEKDNDRVFLAVKQLQDGSTVHFLSITNVARRDAGNYSCKIIHTGGIFEEVTQDTVTIDVWYHPAKESPTCSPTEAFRVTSGIPQILNCSSMDANPPVTIRWTKSGNRPVFGAVEQRSHQGIVTSVLTVTPSSDDDDTVFLCHVISPVFPDFELTCYVGPMIVEVRDGKHNGESNLFDRTGISNGTTAGGSDVPPGVEGNCASTCTKYTRSMRYWILATIASVLIALLLIMINVVLFIRLHQIGIRSSGNTSQHDDPSSRRTLQRFADDIYVDIGDGTSGTLRSMHDFNRVYMTLEGPKKLPARPLHMQEEDIVPVGLDRHYMATFLGNVAEHEPMT